MRPETEADLAEIVAGLSEPVQIVGGGTRGMVSGAPKLQVGALRGTTLYEPGALTLVARAGTPVAEIEAELATEGQRLAFEPMDPRGLLGTDGEPTIGGVVASNNSGPRRIQAGACRDFLLGVRYVDGQGQVIRNGGRVMKNVTGYDLVKLMAGSWGTLGVLSEVSFKVLPATETEATLYIAVPDIETAVSAMSAALGSPFEVTGAAYDPEPGQVLLRVEGFRDSVTYRLGRLEEMLRNFGEIGVAGDSAAVWQAVRDVAPFHERPGDVWRVSVKPGDAAAASRALQAEGLLFDWGGGLVWVLVPEGTDLRARLGALPGHATLVRGAPETRDKLGSFQPEPAPLAALSAGIRAKFDPRGIFNPGLMG